MTFGLSLMKNATDMFEDWLKGIERSVHSNSGGGMRYLFSQCETFAITYTLLNLVLHLCKLFQAV
jgi:hypothetical protein